MHPWTAFNVLEKMVGLIYPIDAINADDVSSDRQPIFPSCEPGYRGPDDSTSSYANSFGQAATIKRAIR